ncbi:MAG TPA: formylglycine-generating enzyme family protein [Sandaracinaceae bacterium]
MDGFDIDRGVSASLLVLAACIACQVPDVRSDAGSEPERDGGLRIVADCEDGWCRIPPGTFVMGSPEDEWGHPARSENQVQVTFTRGFLIQQHELTQREWTALGLPNPSGRNPDGTGACSEPECPVGNVTWFEAVAFANLLSDAEGLPRCYELEDCTPGMGEGMACGHIALTTETLYDCVGYRLPTEAEWEYAVRAGTTTAFYSGDITRYDAETDCNPDPNLQRIAWYCYNSGGTTHPWGQKEPNGWGLYDMSGNAFEWVHDHYTPSGYGEGPLVDPDGDLVLNHDRVFRGGGYNVWASACRSADHLSGSWNNRGHGIGFRLVRTLPDD